MTLYRARQLLPYTSYSMRNLQSTDSHILRNLSLSNRTTFIIHSTRFSSA